MVPATTGARHRKLPGVSVGTPFHERTAPLNRKLAWGDWAGYAAAAAYADHHDIEYNAIRQAVGLIDVSPLYKYLGAGADALRLVDRVITRDGSTSRASAGRPPTPSTAGCA